MEGVENRESKAETTAAKLEELYKKFKNLREHDCIEISGDLLETLKANNIPYVEPDSGNIEKIDKLGLHLKFENGIFKLCSYYFIGVWWFKESEIYIRVKPKEHQNKYADPIAIFLEIAEDNEIADSPEFKNTFRVDMQSPFIELESEDRTFILFVIIKYLSVLEKLVRKGLRKGYVSVEDSLNGRVKGKILTKETYQKHLTRGIHTKTTCKFPILTEDFLENQILKSALSQANKYIMLINYNAEAIINLVNFLSYMFEKVSLRKISDLDFLKVKHSPFFPEYKEALKLAKLILKTIGYDPLRNIEGTPFKSVPPYLINMPKLFELYVWKKLKEKYGDKVRYQPKSAGNIPDFLIQGEGKIVDAKYKYIENSNVSSEDIGQLSRYGRIKKFRKIICSDENNEPELIIAYPVFGNKCFKDIEEYYKISRYGYAIPYYELSESAI